MIVTVYTKPDCVACDQTKRHLRKRGVAFTEGDVAAVRDLAVSRGIMAAPVVVAGPEIWGGYRPDRIDALA